MPAMTLDNATVEADVTDLCDQLAREYPRYMRDALDEAGEGVDDDAMAAFVNDKSATEFAEFISGETSHSIGDLIAATVDTDDAEDSTESIITAMIAGGLKIQTIATAALFHGHASHERAAVLALHAGIEPEAMLAALRTCGSEAVENTLRGLTLSPTEHSIVQAALRLLAAVNRSVDRNDRATACDVLGVKFANADAD